MSTSASKNVCKPTTELHSMRCPCMALLKCRLLYFVFQLTSITDELSYNAHHVEYRASPSRRVGVAGEPARNKASTNNGAVAASLIPPQKTMAAIDRASTSCEVSLPMTEARRNGSVRAAQGMTTSGAMNEAKLEQLNEPGFKKLRSCVGKDGGETKQTLLFFQLKFALAHGHARLFKCWRVKARKHGEVKSVAFGVACVARPEQLVRSTPLLPYAMPKDGKRGSACALAVRSDVPKLRDYFNGWYSFKLADRSCMFTSRYRCVLTMLLCPAMYCASRIGFSFTQWLTSELLIWCSAFSSGFVRLSELSSFFKLSFTVCPFAYVKNNLSPF